MNTSPLVRRLALATVALVGAFAAPPAHAHQLWIGANRYLLDHPAQTPGPLKVSIFTTFGHRLPIDETLDDARFGGVYLLSDAAPSKPVTTGPDGYRVAVLALEKPGAYWLHSVNQPIFSTHMKDAAGKSSYARVPRNEAPAGANIVDTTRIHGFAKTLIQVNGAGATGAVVTQPVGHEFELVPASNPATAAKGDTLRLQVYFQGKPYAGEPVEVVAEHVAAPYLGTAGKWVGDTDAQGRVELPLALPGIWSLVATLIEPATAGLKGKADQSRYRATLTFEVPGAPANY